MVVLSLLSLTEFQIAGIKVFFFHSEQTTEGFAYIRTRIQ